MAGCGKAALLVTAETSAVRRAIGPTAWAVLESLGLNAVEEAGRLVAPVGVRYLARELGINKDTAARVLRRLQGAGLACPVKVAVSGRARLGYQLVLPGGLAVGCLCVSDTAPGRVVPDISACPVPGDTEVRPVLSDVRPDLSDVRPDLSDVTVRPSGWDGIPGRGTLDPEGRRQVADRVRIGAGSRRQSASVHAPAPASSLAAGDQTGAAAGAGRSARRPRRAVAPVAQQPPLFDLSCPSHDSRADQP